MMILFLMFWSPFLAALGSTWLLCRFTGRRWLCGLPLLALLGPLAGGVHEWQRRSFFWELGVLLWAMIAVAIFAGWLIGRALCRGKERTP